MRIRCYGSRGSIAVSGSEYVRYGGDTTCLEIRAASGHTIVIDAGTGLRRLGADLMAEQCRQFYLLFTHMHWDHIVGFPFFQPLYCQQTRIDIFNPNINGCDVRANLRKIMTPPSFPFAFDHIPAEIFFRDMTGLPFEIGSVFIEPIGIQHTHHGFGYRFSENGRAFVFLTDNEVSDRQRLFDVFAAFASEADLLFHDAHFLDSEYAKHQGWGHSSYEAVLALALRAKVRRLGLFHHHPNRTDRQIDAMVTHCRQLLQNQQSPLDCFAARQSDEWIL